MLLAKNKRYRAAGVVLEKHLEQVCGRRNLKVKKTAIAELNESLKKNEVIDFPGYRHIGLLNDIIQVSLRNKKREPDQTDIADLINGPDKIIKTMF